MNDEVNAIPAEVTAPESIETASVETVDTPAPETKAEEAAKTFTQEELDAAIGKRLAREQRKWEREQQQRIQEAIQGASSKPSGDIAPDQFDSTEAYAEALALRKAEELIKERETKKVQQEAISAYHDREEEARSKYEDFEQVAYNPKLPVTDVMAATIQASDIGPDVAYYLGSNPKEAERIAHLAPFLQAKEIGKIEAKLTASPPVVKKTSNAPPPITPVTPGGGNSPAYDLDDPKSLKAMGTSAWIEANRERQRKEWEAKNR